MTANVWIAVIGLALTVLMAMVSGIVWLVRLEGKVNAMDKALVSHETMKMEIVRLQEQIKHLTDLIEKHYAPIRLRRGGISYVTTSNR